MQELTEIFNFHRFDNIRHTDKKLNPRRSLYEVKGVNVVSLLFAAKAGDLSALQRCVTFLSKATMGFRLAC